MVAGSHVRAPGGPPIRSQFIEDESCDIGLGPGLGCFWGDFVLSPVPSRVGSEMLLFWAWGVVGAMGASSSGGDGRAACMGASVGPCVVASASAVSGWASGDIVTCAGGGVVAGAAVVPPPPPFHVGGGPTTNRSSSSSMSTRGTGCFGAAAAWGAPGTSSSSLMSITGRLTGVTFPLLGAGANSSASSLAPGSWSCGGGSVSSSSVAARCGSWHSLSAVEVCGVAMLTTVGRGSVVEWPGACSGAGGPRSHAAAAVFAAAAASGGDGSALGPLVASVACPVEVWKMFVLAGAVSVAAWLGHGPPVIGDGSSECAPPKSSRGRVLGCPRGAASVGEMSWERKARPALSASSYARSRALEPGVGSADADGLVGTLFRKCSWNGSCGWYGSGGGPWATVSFLFKQTSQQKSRHAREAGVHLLNGGMASVVGGRDGDPRARPGAASLSPPETENGDLSRQDQMLVGQLRPRHLAERAAQGACHPFTSRSEAGPLGIVVSALFKRYRDSMSNTTFIGCVAPQVGDGRLLVGPWDGGGIPNREDGPHEGRNQSRVSRSIGCHIVCGHRLTLRACRCKDQTQLRRLALRDAAPQVHAIERLYGPWRAPMCLVTIAASSACDGSPAPSAVRIMSFGFVVCLFLLCGPQRNGLRPDRHVLALALGIMCGPIMFSGRYSF